MEDIVLLRSPQIRASIEDNISLDPVLIALNKRIEAAHLVASQVKYLSRAKSKLPSYYAAKCIIPGLAFEQSSSEECAMTKSYTGELCIDLTCGLGVDALHLSKRFERVITIERDPILAEIARYNFQLLGAQNIEVVNCTAEEFLDGFDAKADLIYADPDRRSESNKKLIRLEDCSPNMVELMPMLRSIAPKIVIKTSPMFDIDQPHRLFSAHTLVEVISLKDECKEVLIEVGDHIAEPMVRATAIGNESVEFNLLRDPARPTPYHAPPYNYIIIPDVSLQKARVAIDYFTQKGVYIESNNGYGFSDTLPQSFMGRVAKVVNCAPFAPKTTKVELKNRNIKRVNILKKDFPLTASQIASQLQINEGGEVSFIFTRFDGKLFVFEVTI